MYDQDEKEMKTEWIGKAKKNKQNAEKSTI